MFSVWKRNFLVWKKLALPSMIGNLLDPLFYMLALGYGLGSFIDEINNISYIAFIATGTVCYGTLNSATFEILYSTFSRMACWAFVVFERNKFKQRSYTFFN